MEWPTFEPVSTEQWWQQIEKDLKGKSADSLWWEVESGFKASPVYHFDTGTQTITPPPPVLAPWHIAEAYSTQLPPTMVNRALIEGLVGGVQAPVLRFSQDTDTDVWPVWLNEVHTEYITTVVEGPWIDNHIEALSRHQAARSRGCWLHQSPPDASMLVHLSKKMPLWRFVTLTAPPESSPSEQIAAVLNQYDTHCATYSQSGITCSQWHPLSVLQVSVGNRYFVEIAKIRAMRYLLAQLAALHGAEPAAPLTFATTTPNYQHGYDPHTNMITNTVHTMAAVIGGGDIVLTQPAVPAADSFHRRIARNVQHLLQQESYLHRVHDPAAGSYALEALTTALARRAWELFQAS